MQKIRKFLKAVPEKDYGQMDRRTNGQMVLLACLLINRYEQT